MDSNFQIDSLDHKILSIITKNARIPFLEVARECNVSGAAIHQRVQRLTRLGILKGSEFRVDAKQMGYRTCAYVGIFLEKTSVYSQVVQKLEKIPEIVQCHYTTGEYSLFIKVYAKDNEHLRRVLGDQLQAIDGVARTETFISLEVMFDRQIPVL